MRKLLVIASFSGALLLASGAASAHGGGWSVAVGPGGVGVSVGSPYYGTLSVGAPSVRVGAAQYALSAGSIPGAGLRPAGLRAPGLRRARVRRPDGRRAGLRAAGRLPARAGLRAPPVVYRPAPVYVVPRWVGGHYVGGPRAGRWGGHHWR